jgi:hypothetical protein
MSLLSTEELEATKLVMVSLDIAAPTNNTLSPNKNFGSQTILMF